LGLNGMELNESDERCHKFSPRLPPPDADGDTGATAITDDSVSATDMGSAGRPHSRRSQVLGEVARAHYLGQRAAQHWWRPRVDCRQRQLVQVADKTGGGGQSEHRSESDHSSVSQSVNWRAACAEASSSSSFRRRSLLAPEDVQQYSTHESQSSCSIPRKIPHARIPKTRAHACLLKTLTGGGWPCSVARSGLHMNEEMKFLPGVGCGLPCPAAPLPPSPGCYPRHSTLP